MVFLFTFAVTSLYLSFPIFIVWFHWYFVFVSWFNKRHSCAHQFEQNFWKGRIFGLAQNHIQISKYSFCHFHSRKRNLETSIALDRKQSNILKPASYHLRMHGYCIYSESHKMFTNVYIVFQTIRYSFVFLLNRCYFISLYSLLHSTRFSTYSWNCIWLCVRVWMHAN